MNLKWKFVVTILVLLEISSVFLMYKSFNNKNVVLDNVKLKGTSSKRRGLAIMIEQEDGTYKESTSSIWPEDMMYNDEKSGCIDDKGNTIDGALTYEGGVANIRTKSSSYCFLYFDLIKDDVTITVSTDGVEGTMPSSGKYTNSATCSSGSIAWSDKYQRIEIGILGKIPSECNIVFTKDTSTKTLLKTEVESKYTTNAKGYRYNGKSPNNYIWFNNEMWRIIGSIPVCLEASCGTNTTNLVKIIRNESIGTLAYDAKASGNTNVWGNNTLYTLLNNYYYGALNGSGTDYCYLYSNTVAGDCDYRSIGIEPDSYYGKMLENVYWNTGTCRYNQSAVNCYTAEINTQTKNGYIGLMNASDYGYSSSYSTTTMDQLATSARVNTIWMNNTFDDQTLTGSTSKSSDALLISVNGAMHWGNNGTKFGSSIRPVVYLNSEVFVISGDGSINSPYIIGM